MSELRAVRSRTKYDDANGKQKWYYGDRFPLLPKFETHPPDTYNVWRANFHWLVFRAWTMCSPDIGFEINLDDQQLQIRFRFPYLITGIFIPLFPYNWHQKLWWTK